ncbi:hypothetical protein GBW32_24390 [Streptomyces tsukubensis]|nr:hypothetical protein GBW32_24390 [Streptomyces tsukubensis]
MAGACAGLVVGLAALAGCGGEPDPDAGTNGVGKLSATKIQAKSRTAARAARTVRLAGAVVSGDDTYKLDMRLNADGGTGEVTSKGTTFALLRVGEHLYLKADAGFWKHQNTKGSAGSSTSDAAAAGKLEGKYVKVPQGDPSYKRLSTFTDKDVLLDGLLTLHGGLAKGERGSTGGVRTVKVTGGKGAGGTLDVSLEGKPYPLLLQRAGDTGTLELTDWNKQFDLREPGQNETVDYGAKLPTS